MTEDQKPSQVAEEGNSAQAKLAAAVFGGYVLGRTKNGGAALSLASWLSGNQAGPRAMAMARKGLSQVVKSEQVAQIMQQIRGPLMEAAQQAVLSRVTTISDQLTARMQVLSELGMTTVEGTGDTVKGAAGGAGDTVKGAAGAAGDTTKKMVKGTAETTKKTGGRLQGALGRLSRKKDGKAEEPLAEEEKPEEEVNEGAEEDRAGSRDETG